MVAYDGAYYLRYYDGWQSSFPFGFPLLVELAGGSVISARLVNAMFGSLLLWPVWHLIKNKTLAWIAIGFLAVHPQLVLWSVQELSEVSYCYLWLMAFHFWKVDNSSIGTLMASLSYLIRPEGLMLAFAITVRDFFKKDYWCMLASSLVIMMIVGLFVMHNYERAGELVLTVKARQLVLDENYFLRLNSLFGFILQLTGAPLLMFGIWGLMKRPTLYWIVIPQFLLMGIKEGNQDLRYALPYFLVLLICAANLWTNDGGKNE